VIIVRTEIIIRRVKTDENDSVHRLVQDIADETFAYLFAASQVPIGDPDWPSAWQSFANKERIHRNRQRMCWLTTVSLP
jgi:hypothetical protein